MKLNLPTKITLARIALIPLMLIFFCLREVFEYYYVLAAAAFVICSCTDFIDGHIARKYDMVTDLGKLLDPIADKILVVAGLAIILADAAAIGINIYYAVFATTVILLREFAIGVFRQIAAAKGLVLQADKLGKIKTVTTMIGISALLLAPLRLFEGPAGIIGEVIFYIGYVFFSIGVLMTIASGINYIVKNKSVFNAPGEQSENYNGIDD